MHRLLKYHTEINAYIIAFLKMLVKYAENNLVLKL